MKLILEFRMDKGFLNYRLKFNKDYYILLIGEPFDSSESAKSTACH